MRTSDVPDVVEFGGHLARADDLADLERRYLHGIGRFTAMPVRGLYVLDPATRVPVRSAVANASHDFLNRYETFGRAIDPILALALTERQAAYNLALMTLPQWLTTSLYRKVAGMLDMIHAVEVPLLARGEVIGTLNFGDHRRSAAAARRCLQDAAVLGRVVGQAIEVVRERVRARGLTRTIIAALEASPTPTVTVTPWPGGAPRPNRVAARLLDQIATGHDLIGQALADPALVEDTELHELPVRLLDGRTGQLRLHIRHPSEGPQAAIVVLALQADDARLKGATLALLSNREREVSELLVDGLTDRQIARRLQLSPHTVSQHVKRIYEKTGAHSRVELTRLILLDER